MKNMLKAIIIDDEPYCCEILAAMLESDCPEVEIKAICYNAKDAFNSDTQQSPDLVFLDVEMPKMNGFEMLEHLPSINFHLIFTTSYDQYALKAIRFSAIDYLLKPIDREELKRAVEKVKDRFQIPVPQQLELLLQKFKQPPIL
jgi:two-component system LytT family response regulator